MNKEQIIQELETGSTFIVFETVNGETREMWCTLNLSYIPEDQHPKNLKKKNSEVQAVFDTTKNEWRAFRWDKLQKVFSIKSCY